MNEQIINLSYLVAAVLFILGLKALSSPRTARKGNLAAAAGMLLAIALTLTSRQIVSFTWIVTGLVVGTAAGALLALTVRMTAMPQMVAVLNGLGGLASALVVLAGIFAVEPELIGRQFAILVAISSLIGWLTFTGSLVAFGKLQGLMTGRPVTFKFQQALNFILLTVVVVLIVMMALEPQQRWLVVPVAVLAGGLGIMFVLPIGGADMPVVISLLNSYSGLAAAGTGFVLGNTGLIIAGSLVGASGIILTRLMCIAMNRSLTNVLFAAVGSHTAAARGVERKPVKRYTAGDAVMVLENAQLVVFVPGYGLAVAQAQHAVKELADLLQSRGVTVKYGIHPVAGRMPGHMNVLLAEAEVPYEQLSDIDEINPEFEHADAVMIIGANDVVNPAARTDKSSPIYGMPILNVDRARTVMILKRSLGPGFSGIDNDLFYMDKTMMLFGDAKETVMQIIAAMKT